MTIRNLDALFKPRSIALIGGSRRDGSLGAVLARNLFKGGFEGPILPVHPRHESLEGVLAYPSVESLPLAPDLAILATPPKTVPQLIAELGARGTRAAVVITAGFGEGGDSGGAGLRQQLLEAAQPHLLRVVGPNCLGMMVPGLGINASFSHVAPPPGDLAFVTQSGAMVTAMLDWAAPRGIGFSKVVSLGDKADVDFGDLLDYLAMDAETRAILLYVESIAHAALPRAPRPRLPTPGRWPAPMRSTTPSSRAPACCGSIPWRSFSTRRRRSPTTPRPAAARPPERKSTPASPSSPTAAVSACWRPTR